MDDLSIAIGFSDAERSTVGALYWEAFGAKLRHAFPGDRVGQDVVTAAMRSDRMLVARRGSDLLGVCGFYREGHGAADVTWRGLRRRLGPLASAWALGVLAVLSRSESRGVLVLDGICVAETARDAGVGTRLLEAAVALGREAGDRAVQLSVIDSNPRARDLYERRGFVETGRGSLGPLRHLYGFDGYRTLRRDTARTVAA